MALNATENWVLTGQSPNDFNRNYGSYEGFRDAVFKIQENAPLFLKELNNRVTAADLKAHYDGVISFAIGYGVDLLVRTNSEIDTYLGKAGLSKLTAADKAILDLARPIFQGYRTIN